MDPRPPLQQGGVPAHNRRRTDDGRRNSDRAQAQLAALIECADDAIFSTTPDGEIESWNVAAERIFGYSAAEIIGRPARLLVPPESEGEEKTILEHIRRGHTVDRYETARRHKNGEAVFVSLTVSPIKDTHGRVIGISEIAHDVSESRRAEKRLRESEARYRELFQSSRDGILSIDNEGHLTDANPAALNLLGYTLEELRHLLCRQITPPRWHDVDDAIVREQVETRGYSDVYEKEYIRKDGSVVPISVRRWLMQDREQPRAGMWALVRDLTEHKRADETLRQNQARWRSLFENAPVAIWEEDLSAVRRRFDELRSAGIDDLDRHLREHPEETRRLAGLVKILDMSQTTLETFNVSRFADLPSSLPDYFADGSLAMFRELLAALWSGRRRFSAETPIRTPAGERRLVDVRLSVVPGFEQNLTRVLVSFLDITERRRTEEALRESEQRFRGLAEGMPHIVWETDARGAMLYQNAVWYDYVGRARDAPGASEWLNDIHPDEREHVWAEWTESVRREGAHVYDIEARLRRRDGAYRWFRIKGAPIRDGSGKVAGWAGTCTDVHDQKVAAERLEFAQRAGKVGFYDHDFATGRSVWTEGLARLFGTDLRNYDGNWDSWAERHVAPEDAAAVAAQIQNAIRDRAEHIAYEFRAVLPDGTQRWLGGRGQLVYDAAGQPLSMAGMTADISERKRLEHELEERARQLADADRRKDEFLATLAHELRNPLAPIRTSVDIVRMKAGDNTRLQWAADTIARQVQHLNHIVGDLLDLARIAQGKVSLNPEPCNFSHLVQRAVEMNRDGIKMQHHQLRVDLPQEELQLHADPARLVQVFSNLINNAVKYTPGGGVIAIVGEREDGSVALHVRDTGIGIKPELLPYVFDLFVQGERTLARAEGGLGIGLTLVRRITELHGGSVRVASRGLNQGAVFTVRLPLAPLAAPGARPPAETAAYRATEAPKRILIVEDNRDAADSLGYLLGDLGHDVQIAYEGREGLYRALEVVPDVAILDIGLPGLSGYELARLFRQEPKLKDILLVASSGYGQQTDIEESHAAGFDYHLIKPFDMRDLNAILGSRAAPPH